MTTSGRAMRGVRREHTRWIAVVLGAVLIGGGHQAAAAMTTPICLAKKLHEWGKLRSCEAKEGEKKLEAKPADPARCRTRFDVQLARLSELAKVAGLPCRYQVNGDGTVTD
jgi:hypothetical protein